MATNRGTISRIAKSAGKNESGIGGDSDTFGSASAASASAKPTGVESGATGIDSGIRGGIGVGNVDDHASGNKKPRKARQQKTDAGTQTTLEFESAQVDIPAPSRKRKPKAPTIKTDGAEAARFLLEAVEVFTVAQFGPQAAFNPSERFMIESPLARLIEKYAPVMDRFGGWIDPIMVIGGFAYYGKRLSELSNANKPTITPSFTPPPGAQQGTTTPEEPPAQSQAYAMDEYVHEAVVTPHAPPVANQDLFDMIGSQITHDRETTI